jgi:hypothetical protein
MWNDETYMHISTTMGAAWQCPDVIRVLARRCHMCGRTHARQLRVTMVLDRIIPTKDVVTVRNSSGLSSAPVLAW